MWQEDRKKLDSRRVGAVIVDGLITAALLIPLNVFFDGLTPGAWLVYLALQLGYFHVLESINGQTLGKRLFDLRVVRKDDAGPASAKAISARTVLRLIDILPGAYLVGVLSMLLSDKRRQRLGDLAAGTVVTRASARPYTSARHSALQTVYPSIWLGAALAVVLAVGHGGDPGLAALDRICEQATHAEAALGPAAAPQDVFRLRLALVNQLYGLQAQSKKELAVGNELIRDKMIELQLLRAGQPEAAATMARNHHQELADRGVKHC
ncbi:MAG: RDD family protein [Solirubrobacteraceae bacterium]